MALYRKKPVVVEARQFRNDEGYSVLDWINRHQFNARKPFAAWIGDELHIPTLEGMHTASIGDMIIRGVAGEFYPCKPDIFERTYEPEPEPEPEIIDAFDDDIPF